MNDSNLRQRSGSCGVFVIPSVTSCYDRKEKVRNSGRFCSKLSGHRMTWLWSIPVGAWKQSSPGWPDFIRMRSAQWWKIDQANDRCSWHLPTSAPRLILPARIPQNNWATSCCTIAERLQPPVSFAKSKRHSKKVSVIMEMCGSVLHNFMSSGLALALVPTCRRAAKNRMSFKCSEGEPTVSLRLKQVCYFPSDTFGLL